jgi:hypothetical protein
MSLRPAILRLVLPVLVLLIGTSACRGASEGTVKIVVSGERPIHGLRVDQCEGSVGPDEVLTIITLRDMDGDDVAHMTVFGRDATVESVGDRGRRCALTAVKNVQVPKKGVDYKITIDGETSKLRWPEGEPPEHQWFDSPYIPDTATVGLYARGWVPLPAQVFALVEQGYFRLTDLARFLGTTRDRAAQLTRRDDFPSPAMVIGRRQLWRSEDVKRWNFTRRNRPSGQSSEHERGHVYATD